MNKKIRQATASEIREVYQSNIIPLIRDLRKRCYLNNNCFVDMYNGVIISRNGFNQYVANKVNKGFEYRIWLSQKTRRQRLRNRITKMINKGNAKFLTLTFNNEFFDRETSEITRRRYIARFLKEQCKEYVANIDYGEKNNREHYHAVVIPKAERIDYSPYCACFDGSRIYSEDIRVSKKSKDSISRYIDKLTNHALKESGKAKRLIYSR